MAQRRNMRIADDRDAVGRPVPFSVPGASDGSGTWRRGSARYGSSSRRSGRVRISDMPPGSVLSEQARVRPARMGLLVVVAFLLVCVCVLAAFVLTNSDGKEGMASSQVVTAAGVAITEVQAVGGVGFSAASVSAPSLVSGHSSLNSYDLSSDDVLGIPGTAAVSELNMNAGFPSVDEPPFSTAAIQEAVSAIERYGDCGFVFLDVDSGYGLTYNADEAMYVASAAKAPFVYWLASSGAELGEYEEELVQYTIVDSDNDSFFTLFLNHYREGYASFMESYGVQHEDYEADFFPRMAARNLAGVWADILNDIRGGSGAAEWLSGLFASTETSFIRDGLRDTGAVVMDKAGWIDEPDYDGDYHYDEESGEYVASGGYVSVTDAAIVQAGGRTYLMVIATSQSDSYAAEDRVSELARALFDAREAM